MMIEDFPRLKNEIQQIQEHFPDIKVTKYTADTDFLKSTKKSIIVDTYFNADHADARQHFLHVQIVVSTAGVMDDEFFILHGYYRNQSVSKNVNRNLYLCQYTKEVPVVIDYGD